MRRFIVIICLLFVGCSTEQVTTPAVSIVTAIPTTQSTAISTPVSVNIENTENCDVEQTETLAPYVPSSNTWIQSDGTQLISNDAPFHIYGVNFYPRMSPFDLFLMDTETDVLAKELDVIIPAGINTLRIYVNLEQLFLCEIQATPNINTFNLLDSIITTIANKNLHTIIVLNQTISNPEQSSWEQLQFLAQRYATEPAILAWDVLENGDSLYENLTSETVLTWLANAIQAIRQVDNQHLITASWQNNAQDTIEWVDIVSFQHFGDYLSLRQGITDLKSLTSKPILLSAIGFSTFDVDETAQRNLLFQAIEEVENNSLAGWTIYMAFDYPTSVTCEDPNCPADPASINFYGIWNTSYFPKLAVDAVKRVTGVMTEE